MSSLQLVKFMGHLNLKESQASINWKTSHIQHLDIPKWLCETWKKNTCSAASNSSDFQAKNHCRQVTVWLAFAVAVALKLPVPVASAWWMTGFSWDFPLKYRGFPGRIDEHVWKCPPVDLHHGVLLGRGCGSNGGWGLGKNQNRCCNKSYSRNHAPCTSQGMFSLDYPFSSHAYYLKGRYSQQRSNSNQPIRFLPNHHS